MQHLLIFSDTTTIELYLPQGKFENRQKIDIEGFKTYDNAGIEFDPHEFKIYWIQDKNFRINTAFINGTGM